MKSSNFIGNFLEHLSSVGLQRNNRYVVLLRGPDISTTKGSIGGKEQYFYGDEVVFKDAQGKASPITSENQKRLALTCSTATLSGKSLATKAFGTIGSGPLMYFPYAENYTNEVVLEFNCSTDFFERHYFAKWMHQIINPVTHDVAYYDDYAKNWKLLVVALPPDVSSFEKVAQADFTGTAPVYGDGPTPIGDGPDHVEMYNTLHNLYYIRLHEVYPVEIEEGQVSNSDGGIMKIKVKLKYRYYDDPMTAYMQRVEAMKNQDPTFEESPFAMVKKIVRDIARYSDPKELKQLVVDQGLGQLNDIIGVENVEAIAQGGQVIDVYRRTPNKDRQTTQGRLIRPLGGIIGGTI